MSKEEWLGKINAAYISSSELVEGGSFEFNQNDDETKPIELVGKDIKGQGMEKVTEAILETMAESLGDGYTGQISLSTNSGLVTITVEGGIITGVTGA